MEILYRDLGKRAEVLHRDLAQQLLQRTRQGDLAHDLLQRSSQRELAESYLVSLLNFWSSEIRIVWDGIQQFLG